MTKGALVTETWKYKRSTIVWYEGTKMSLKETEAQDLAVSLEWLQKELCGLIYKYPPVVMETAVYLMSLMDIDSKNFQ